MNSISEVKYFLVGTLIRTSSKIEIEESIINENVIKFVLAYSSPLLQSLWLEKIGLIVDSDFSV